MSDLINTIYGKGKMVFGLILLAGSYFVTNVQFDLTPESKELITILGQWIGGSTAIFGLLDKFKRKLKGE